MTPAFSLNDPVGTLTLEPLRLNIYASLLHAWIVHPRSAFWGMQNSTVAEVRAEYERIAADPHHHSWLGRVDKEPLFLVETYEPAHSELAVHYPVAPGDIGMHLLVAPPRTPRHGLTSAVMWTVMEFLFADARTERVVVEPNIRNDKIAAKNAEVGFIVEREIQLATKIAQLSFCTRTEFSRRRRTP